jgi:hypothetical protein
VDVPLDHRARHLPRTVLFTIMGNRLLTVPLWIDCHSVRATACLLSPGLIQTTPKGERRVNWPSGT